MNAWLDTAEVFEMSKDLKKVLIVDDEETLTWSMAKSLSKDKDKYEVMIANNGREALHLLKKSRIDLVISDIRMPDINGLDLLVMIKKEYPRDQGHHYDGLRVFGCSEGGQSEGVALLHRKTFRDIGYPKDHYRSHREERKGFKGKVFDVQLTDIIQMNCLSRLTTALDRYPGWGKGGHLF